jgi:adenylate cyclase
MAALAQQKLLRKTVDGLVSGREREVRVRMGLASGVATAGNMGSERKFQYTVMGDVVNVASRLEPANKDFGTSILISESTYNQVRETMLARPLGEILVAGRKQATFIYELMCMKHEATAGQQTVARSYAKALELLQNRQWDSCITVLDEILREFEDRPSEILRDRAMGYRESPPPDSWHGEYVRRAKL